MARKFDYKNWKTYTVIPVAICYLIIMIPVILCVVLFTGLGNLFDWLAKKSEDITRSNVLWINDLTKWRKGR